MRAIIDRNTRISPSIGRAFPGSVSFHASFYTGGLYAYNVYAVVIAAYPYSPVSKMEHSFLAVKNEGHS